MILIPILIIHICLFFICIIRYFKVKSDVKSKIGYFVFSIVLGAIFSLVNIFISIICLSGQTINAYELSYFVLLGPIPILFLCGSWFVNNRLGKKTIQSASLGLALGLAVSFSIIPWFSVVELLITRFSLNLTY